MIPQAHIADNSYAYETEALIKPTGFREYDARWVYLAHEVKGKRFEPEINALGIQMLGTALGNMMHERLSLRRIVVGHDFRSYSVAVKQALIVGLMSAGVEVVDIGLALSPMAYFAQFALDIPAVAMVTASHNDNGWTGVKMGMSRPLTFGPDEMSRLREIALAGGGPMRTGGQYRQIHDFRSTYLDEIAGRLTLSRPIRVICACGNGTAGAFAPEALRRMGAEVVELDTKLDWNFPRYNPNPEDHEMLYAMSEALQKHGAELALGFDGDGDRCGVVDDLGEEIFADKIGLLLARDLAPLHPGASFLVDVKSTGLFATDAILRQYQCKVEYWKTGHSHMKRRCHETGALAAFEKSGHYFFAPPFGRGYDDGLVAAAAILAMLDRAGSKKLSDLRLALPDAWTSLTMSPFCADETKYDVVARIEAEYQALFDQGGSILGRRITQVNRVNGARVMLEDGSWLLIRASSNKPELATVVESAASEDDMRDLFRLEVKPRLQNYPVGAFNQEI